MNTSDTRIGWFLLMAVAVHALGFGWYVSAPVQQAARLPDWVKVRISITTEELQVPASPGKVGMVKKQAKPVYQPATPALENVHETTKDKQQQEVQEKKDTDNKEHAPAPAPQFVQADSRPFEIINPRPFYPGNARKRGLQGTVQIQAHVTAEGTVSAVHILKSSGYRILDLSAMKSIRAWRFSPAQRDGVPVATKVQIPVRYLLAENN